MSESVPHECMEDVYEDAPCGFLFTRPDGTIVRVNQTLLAWTGYERADLTSGRRFQDLLTIPGKIFYENQYFPVLRLQGAVKEVAFDFARPGREPLPVLVNSVQRTTPDGLPSLIASTIFDATDRRAYERELLLARRDAEQLAAVVRMSSDAIVTTSPVGLVQTWNAAAERLFGYPADAVTGTDLRDILSHGEDDVAWNRLMAELGAGHSVSHEMVGRRADGGSVDVSVGMTPHPDPLGHLGAISAIIRDIGERREIERLQQEFLAMAAHELRSPLTGIRAHAQLMRRRAAYSDRAVDAIMVQTDRLARLIDDLLLASQIEADRVDLRLEDLDLVLEARSIAESHGVDGVPIRVEAPDGPVMVPADRGRLSQVLANLITNAVKYSPEGGEVVMRFGQTADEAWVAVADQGIGIQREALAHLFDRFYRVAEAASRVPGIGLGLYISRRIVEAHHGRIEVESVPGEGSTFTVVLPVRRDTGG